MLDHCGSKTEGNGSRRGSWELYLDVVPQCNRFLLEILLFLACLGGFGCATERRISSESAERADRDVRSRVAIIHFRPQLLQLDQNIAELTTLTSQAFARGANFVLIPEQATTGFSLTKSNVENGMAISAPFKKLDPLKQLAIQHHGFVTLGIAERGTNDLFFNSAVTFGPGGDIHVQRKRLAAENANFGWNARGDTPFDVFPTPFGNVGVVICADTFLMDWPRIAALEGADILLVPANWWGENDQMSLWQVRAKQNGVWIVVANRWGSEPNFFPPPADYYMDDSPSAVFDSEGQAKAMYRVDEQPVHRNRIIYYDLSIPKTRIGTGAINLTPTVQNRRITAYGALTNNFYTPESHNQSFPGLPPTGIIHVQLVSYSPDPGPAANLKTLQDQVTKGNADVVLMPGLGYTSKPIDPDSNPKWYRDPDWSRLASFAADRDLELLMTSAVEVQNGRKNEALVIFQRGSNPRLIGQIHDSGSLRGTGEAPALIDLGHSRVALLTGLDSLFPETATAAAKNGADTILICSSILGRGSPALEAAGIDQDVPVGWTFENFHNNCKVMAKNCVHVAAVDISGMSIAEISAGYSMLSEDIVVSSFTYPIIPLDSSNTRYKLLNYYYPFDIKCLVSANVNGQ